MNPYQKGAAWRIWDLQIQTILDDGYKSLASYYEQLKELDAEKWGSFVSRVGGESNALFYDSKGYFGNDTIPKKERCVNHVSTVFAFLEIYKPHLGLIGITDHNYHDEMLLDEFASKAKNATCQVLCGVEINVSGIHMLVYFAAPPYSKTTFSEGVKTFLSKIGVDAPKTGNVLNVCNKAPQDVIKEIQVSDGIFIYPHCNSDNGLFQERPRTDRTLLSNIFNHLPAVVLQSNNKESIEKVANYIATNPSLFKSKAIFTTASDARCLNEYGKADKDGNYQWIKADPTFNGFKQILYEPTSRVRIEKERPEDKQDYLVIDNVRFIGKATDITFPQAKIEVNDKLNAIIGGKSSGKSILLYYIAKTIDSKQVSHKIADSKLDLAYDFEKEPEFDFEVKWKDGETFTLKNNTQEKSRQITYVPQMYINYLAEKGGQSELRKLIQEILEQKPEFKVLYDAQVVIVTENKVKLTAAIETYFQIREQLKANAASIRSKGDKKAREENIRQKIEEIDALRKSSGFTPEEETRYQELRTLQSIYNSRFTNLTGFKQTYESDYVNHLTTLKTNIGPSLNNIHINTVAKFLRVSFLGEFISKEILSDNKRINDLLDELIAKARRRIEKVDDLLVLNDERLAYFRGLVSPYLQRIKNQEKLDELNEVISQEQLVLDEIAGFETTRSTLLDSQVTAKKDFLKAYENIFESYKAIADTVNSNPDFSNISIEKGIILSSKVVFNISKFRENIISLINSQGYLSSKIGTFINGDNDFIYDEATHLQSIELFFEKILDHESSGIKFNAGGDVPTVAKKLFQDFFIVKYELSQNQESILKMSPGKKGMILLFLILHLSNAAYPILIDQPEDNLDNRTVYKELKEFIKEKKITRQIIIVTHNANLVVPTDAENIIIANQNGQDNSKDNEKYRFEYITGSLENSFENTSAIGILNQMGVKEHVCDILEGGSDAFMERELKYNLK
ncbi:MAG: hypothetical protein V4456_00695 [Bacteroidota bacterium]